MTANSEPRLLRAGNPGPLTGDGNNTWLVDGAEPTLIDAGVGAPDHLEAIARALDGRALVRVLVTHGHSDHASGVPALSARWPALDVRQWQPNAETGSRALADGERVRAGDVALVVVYTPGHAADHVCFWNEASRDLYTGDMAVKGSTVMIPAGRGGNLRDYLRSLERLAALQPLRMLPGHGPVIDRPLELIAEYIEHRHAREAQVLQCLTDGVTDLEEMVGRIYPDISPDVRQAARLTIDAHLEKIREDRERRTER